MDRKHVSGLAGEGIPSVAIGVYGRERNATIDNLQQRLVSEHQGTLGSGWYGLGETNDSIVINNSSRLDCCRSGSSNDGVSGEGEAQ